MQKVCDRFTVCVMYLAAIAAIIGVRGCIFFMGDAKKEDNVSAEAGKQLMVSLKEMYR